MTGIAAYEQLGLFYLGRETGPGASAGPLLFESKDLTTHAVCVGMTGSGKTGLGIALLEEAAIDGIPAIAIDPKGDLGNLALAFPRLRPEDFAPWIEPDEASRAGRSVEEQAAATAERWREGLAAWDQHGERIERLRDAAEVRIYTPGLASGRPLSVLASLEPPGPAVAGDPDALRERVSATVSGTLALLGLDADPLRSREHILLSLLVSRRWQEGSPVDLGALIRTLQRPPFDRVGVIDLEWFFPAKERFELAMALNNLLASPGFAAWLEGEPLRIPELLHDPTGRPRISVLSIAHLSDPERMFFVTLLLNEVVAWMRGQSGTRSLRAVLYMDEVFGYLPPTANPPSKAPLLTLLKQGRAFGLGTVLATQNPVDLDYKALSNAGTWWIGRLQTERDKARLRDGLLAADAGVGLDARELDALLSGLGARHFLQHNVHEDAPVLFESRWALSYLRGPLPRAQLRELARPEATEQREPSPSPAADAPPATPAAGERPVLPAAVDEAFAASDVPEPLYVPTLLVEATLHYVRRGLDLDAWEDVRLRVPLAEEAHGPVWEAATSRPSLPELREAPAEGARFARLPAEAQRPASYRRWQKQARERLYRERERRLYRAPALRMVSEAGEDEAAFRVRVRERAREKRDLALEKLRARYAPKLERARERIRAAEARLERETDEYRDARLQAAVGAGASLLQAVLGRRLASATNVGRAGTAARRAGRAARQRGDVGRAWERIRTEQARLATLEKDFAEKLEVVRERFAEPPGIEGIGVPPRKSDLIVSRMALLWEPRPEALPEGARAHPVQQG